MKKQQRIGDFGQQIHKHQDLAPDAAAKILGINSKQSEANRKAVTLLEEFSNKIPEQKRD